MHHAQVDALDVNDAAAPEHTLGMAPKDAAASGGQMRKRQWVPSRGKVMQWNQADTIRSYDAAAGELATAAVAGTILRTAMKRCISEAAVYVQHANVFAKALERLDDEAGGRKRVPTRASLVIVDGTFNDRPPHRAATLMRRPSDAELEHFPGVQRLPLPVLGDCMQTPHLRRSVALTFAR